MNKNKTIAIILGLFISALLVWFLVSRSSSPKTAETAGKKEEHGHGSEEGGHEEAGEDSEELALNDEQIQASGIKLAAAGPGELNIEVSLPGEVKLNADNLSHIVPRFGGAITEINKKLGDKVVKGEVLAIIESNESLASYQVKALSSGTVIQKHATVGEVVPENTEVFVVANLDTVWVDLNVYPKDLPYLQEGQAVQITGPSKNLTASGKISYVGPTLSEHTRTAMARAIIPNKDGKWRPGMFVTTKVATDNVKVEIMVPKQAVQKVEGKPSVFVRTEKGFLAKAIGTGREDSLNYEVTEGLEAGEQIAVEGAFVLKAEKGKSEAEHDH